MPFVAWADSINEPSRQFSRRSLEQGSPFLWGSPSLWAQNPVRTRRKAAARTPATNILFRFIVLNSSERDLYPGDRRVSGLHGVSGTRKQHVPNLASKNESARRPIQ